MSYHVTNPASGLLEADFGVATDVEIADALDRTDRAFGTWRRSELKERRDVVRRVAELYGARADELAAIITREMGKTTREALEEVQLSVEIYTYYADNAERLLADEPLTTSTGGKAWLRKAAIGPILGIMPWNFPYYQVARFAAPNLMAGNTVLLKPAPQCPESAAAMAAIFTEAGLPPDVYINVLASDDQAGAIIADPRTAAVSVTGSERAGSAVAAIAGKHLKKVVLELGGSDPFVVIGPQDMAEVVRGAVAARMENAGQSCNAAKRMIVTDNVYDEFVEEFSNQMAAQVTGDPNDPMTTYGPMSSELAAVTLMEQVQDAIDKGATVHVGGKRVDGPGWYVEATVLSGVVEGMRAFREELFGPVAVVHRVANVAEAIVLANDTPYGLGGAVFCQDEALALEVADQLDVGMVWINEPEGGGADLPFGGTKRSGIGRELGPLGMDEFVNKKLMHLPAK
ncbi:MAG: 6-oxohexanoate dehydrogenase [Marmoricola sp.]|nr:6-oxohexanoate dehydrogenase [Marmoricola sp.]